MEKNETLISLLHEESVLGHDETPHSANTPSEKRQMNDAPRPHEKPMKPHS